jgi:hypothetical protein
MRFSYHLGESLGQDHSTHIRITEEHRPDLQQLKERLPLRSDEREDEREVRGDGLE